MMTLGMYDLSCHVVTTYYMKVVNKVNTKIVITQKKIPTILFLLH